MKTNPYDHIAEKFNTARTGFREKLYLDRLLAHLHPTSMILDLGCGTGVPIAAYLVAAGQRVIGVDSSQAMLDLAQRQVPDAEFIRGDMLTVDLDQSFEAIVAWDSIFHLPRERQPLVFERCYRWLKPNGLFLLSLGGSEWEGTSEMHGQLFFYSGYEPTKSRSLLEATGFSIIAWEIDDSSSRGHLAVLARREIKNDSLKNKNKPELI